MSLSGLLPDHLESLLFRQIDREPCASANLRGDRYPPAMLLYDTLNDRQTKAGSFSDFFSCEKRVENLGLCFWWDSVAIVHDLDDQAVAISLGDDGNLSSIIGGGLACVRDQIKKYLINLRR